MFCRSITKTSCSDDIGHLKERDLEALGYIGIEMEDIVGNENTSDQNDRDIGPQSLVFKEGLEFSDHEVVVEVEVHPKDQNPNAN